MVDGSFIHAANGVMGVFKWSTRNARFHVYHVVLRYSLVSPHFVPFDCSFRSPEQGFCFQKSRLPKIFH